MKGWAVTFSLATMLAAFHPDAAAARRLILGDATLATLFFWIIDAIWKGYQNAYRNLLALYEHQIAEGNLTRATGLLEGWAKFHTSGAWPVHMVQSSSLLPYLPIVLIGLALLLAAQQKSGPTGQP